MTVLFEILLIIVLIILITFLVGGFLYSLSFVYDSLRRIKKKIRKERRDKENEKA